jgi:hypothetical protein
MKIWELREYDILEIQREAILQAANCVGITHPELKDNVELKNILNQKDPALADLLTNFLSTYWNFFYFSKAITAHGKSYEMTSAEKDKLAEFIRDKGDKRRQLVARFNLCHTEKDR